MIVLLEPAIIAAIIMMLFSGVITILRYIFDVQLITGPEVDKKIAEANAQQVEEFNRITETLEEHSAQLKEIEELIMGSEYQVSDGMLELVEMNREDVMEQDERIEGVERIQLKIRRRQQEYDGGDEIAHGEDLNPPPNMETDTNTETNDSD